MSHQSNLQGLFERPTTLPDPDAQSRLARLVGMNDKIKRLANVLGVLINPVGLRKWQDKHHADAGGLPGADGGALLPLPGSRGTALQPVHPHAGERTADIATRARRS